MPAFFAEKAGKEVFAEIKRGKRTVKRTESDIERETKKNEKIKSTQKASPLNQEPDFKNKTPPQISPVEMTPKSTDKKYFDFFSKYT